MDTSSRRVSMLLWAAVCAMVLLLCLPALLVGRPGFADKGREPFVNLVKNWEVAFGSDAPQAGDWKPFDGTAQRKLDGYRGTVWLQRSLPELDWRNPYLFVSGMNRFEVRVGGEQVYQFNRDGAIRWNHYRLTLHPIPVDAADTGRPLLIRSEWEGYSYIGNDMVLAGEPDQLLYALLQAEAAYLLNAVLFLASGLAGLALLISRRGWLYGWFSLLALSAGITLLFSCRVLQWFAPVHAMYYWKDLLLPLAMYAFIGFYGEALRASRVRVVAVSRRLLLVYLAVMAGAAGWRPLLYDRLSIGGAAVVAAAGLAVVSYALLRYPPPSAYSSERKWLIRGYWALALCSLGGFAAALFPHEMSRLMSTHHYAYRVIEALQPNGLLLFLICMIMVIVSSVRRVHLESERNARELLVKNRELEQFHRNLEKLVDKRTAELEQSNRRLSVTLREKAESLAEISVLEERNRIAYEIHDVVGHTLTSSIVQLEATKKLAERGGGVPVEKLELLSGLIRKGLDDIRRAVRLLKTEEQALSLEEALYELIRDAETTTEVRIEAAIELPRELQPGKLTEQVLVHALQEGLTNGIRHGRASRFRFTLRPDPHERLLRFRLVSDGDPFGSAEPGFGLTSMAERVRLLDGSVSVRSSEAEDGSPSGCELAIDVPLPSAAAADDTAE